VTRRADPNASLDVASRHFFRHLDDPHELIRNPLTKQIADHLSLRLSDVNLLANIRKRIEAILEHYADLEAPPRHSTLVHRRIALFKSYVLARRPIRHVLKNIGLSRRQFFRDYSSICKIVLARLIPETPVRRVTIQPVAIPLGRAQALAEVGRESDAVRLLADMIDNGANPAVRARAAQALARLHLDCGQYRDAELALQTALRFWRLGDRTSVAESRMRVEVAALHHLLTWRTNRSPDEAFHGTNLSADVIRNSFQTTLDSEHYTDWLIACASQEIISNGNADKASALLSEASILLDASRTCSLRQRAEWTLAYTQLIVFQSIANVSRAIDLLNDAAASAQQNGFVFTSTIMSMQLATYYRLIGNKAQQESMHAHCLEGCKALHNPLLWASLYLIMAYNATSPARAIECFHQVPKVYPHFDIALISGDVKAQAHNDLHQHRIAIDVASEGYQVAEKTGRQSMRGACLRELARGQFAIGEKRKAKYAISRSLEILRGHASEYLIKSSEQLSSVISA
jgi:hypothetical protein